jgi:serine protease Do
LDRESFAHRHSHLIIILLAGVLGALLALLAIYGFRGHMAQAPVFAQGDAGAAVAVEKAFVDVAARTLPAVVNISAERVSREKAQPELPDLFKDFPFDFKFGPETPKGGKPPAERGQSLGSGWVYSPDGYIVTNYHVVQGGTNIKVTLYDDPKDDRQYPAKVIGADPRTELAVIKIDAPRKLPTLSLGDSEAVKVGQWTMAVGAPFGLQQTVTVGVVSAKGRFIPGQSKFIRIGDVIQTDAAINPGNSGGPLCGVGGQVMGINVAIVSPGMVPGNVGIGFAIPANTAKDVIPQLIKSGKVARGWLGITIEDLTPNMRDFYGAPDGGALVTGIQPEAPAAQSQLKEDDVIVAVDGQKIRDTWELQKHVAERKPGTELALDILRGKKPMQVKLKLGEMPGKYTGLEGGGKPGAPESASTALGLRVAAITPDVAKGLDLPRKLGVVVLNVDTQSPAYGQIQRGDVIIKINDAAVTTVDDYAKAVAKAEKDRAKFLIFRLERKGEEGETMTIVADIPTQW